MPAYRTEIKISSNGTLLINNLPFQKGDVVEVVIRNRETKLKPANPYSLRGTPVQYLNPFESVAEDAWNVLS